MATQASDFFEPQPRATPADELAAIVQRAQALTNASGAATAISEANSNHFVCRASCGSVAPEVGIALRVEGTFTGMCIQSGKELICDDAAVDARVDTTAIRELDIRSIAVTPIKEDGRVIGVLAVFSLKPHAFTAPLVGVLNALADQITGVMRKERRSREERCEPALSLAKPSASPASPLIVLTPAGSLAAADSLEATEPASNSAPDVSNAESIWTVPGASDIAPALLALEEAGNSEQKVAEFASPDHRRLKPRSESAHHPLYTPHTITAWRERGLPDKFLLIGATVAVLALAATTIGLLKMRNPGTATPIQPSQHQENSGLSAPSTAIASGPARQTGDTLSGAKPEGAERIVSENKSNQSAQKTSQPLKAAQPNRAVTLPGSKMTLASVSSSNELPNVAPTTGLGSSSGSDLTLLARPVSNSPPAIVPQSELVKAKVIRAVPALYPPMARARGVGGEVVLMVIVGKDGKVSHLKFISGSALLRNAAFDAVKQWLFQPAMLNGQPIEQETQVILNFNFRP